MRLVIGWDDRGTEQESGQDQDYFRSDLVITLIRMTCVGHRVNTQ